MKWLITGVYTVVIGLALVVAFDGLGDPYDWPVRAFVCGMAVFLSVIQAVEEWREW